MSQVKAPGVHTALPLRAEFAQISEANRRVVIRDASGAVVASVGNQVKDEAREQEQAALIVRAVNAHAELVETLQMMHDNFGPKIGTLGHAYQRGFAGDGRTPTIGPANGSAADKMFQIGKRVGAILAKLSGGAA